MSTQISLEEFNAATGLADGDKFKKSRKAKEKEVGEDGEVKEKKKEISAPLSFSLYLESFETNFAARDGTIYQWTGAYWKALAGDEPERLAIEWLALNRPEKCSEKMAQSCAATAALRLPPLPKRDDNNSNIVLIPCRNGTLHVESEGVCLHDHKKSDGITFNIRCDYVKSVKTPMFDQYLDSSLPDLQVRSWLQEYAGYTLVSDSRHQIALWLQGEGSNGKGIFAEIIEALHGKTVAAGIGVGDLDGFRLESLIGASLILVDETPQRIDEQKLKTLISGDSIRVDRKYRDPVTLRSCGKWIVNGNALPSLTDQSDGFWRRWIIVTFDQKPAVIPNLARSIINSELPGVLNWAVAGLERLLARGHFPPLPDRLADEKKKARTSSNSVAGWLEDREVRILDLSADSANAGCAKAGVYLDYQLWTKINGLSAVSSIKFWERVRMIHPGLKEFRRGEKQRERCMNLFVPEFLDPR